MSASPLQQISRLLPAALSICSATVAVAGARGGVIIELPEVPDIALAVAATDCVAPRPFFEGSA